MYYGAIEAGGTKFVCAVSDDNYEILERVSIPTTTPNQTMNQVFAFFDGFSISSIGIGSFGPIDINESSETYGFITTTPKQGWKNFDFVGCIKNRYNIPIAWTTDVNAAAYGEYHKGNAQGYKSCLYLTVGTGIGGGVVINGEILKGFGHPEMGHLLVRQHAEDNYQGACPYHKNCLEGVASGTALEGRYKKKGQALEHDNKVWEMEAFYLAQALVNYTLVLRPEIIILGGGVMQQKKLYKLVSDKFHNQMNNYVETPDLSQYIVKPGLEDNAGIIGCLLLASEAGN